MSVLIRGMEMPTTPVLFCIHPDGKVFADMEGLWKEYSAVPVPPHGRLIDADALAQAVNDFPYGYRGMILAEVAIAPTIIPESKEN